MFWESQRGHLGISKDEARKWPYERAGCAKELPVLRRVRAGLLKLVLYLSNPHVTMAEFHVTLPHFGVVDRRIGGRQIAGRIRGRAFGEVVTSASYSVG